MLNTDLYKKEGEQLQIIEGIIRKKDDQEESNFGDYLTRGELNDIFVNKLDAQALTGSKSFTNNANATSFVKTGKDETSVLLADGSDVLLSSLGGVQVKDITNLIVNLDSNNTFNYFKLTRVSTFCTLMMKIQPKIQIITTTATVICSIGTVSTGISPPIPPSTTYPISLATKRKKLTCVHSFRDI
ncbi:MAG: hypothetical protein EZS28_020640 [Streblomastix strix]|uniref:Uncharacterized protein n=1 Tax=Streblomastix strix TaxID=222440 RepID=A0A5J4VMI3_9EUKA|nr:MAG: hypothetical protein EZS28_020640 [Streblomastix strix]